MCKSFKYSYFFILPAFFLISGCKKFLKQEDPSNYTVSSFYKTANDARLAVNAIYSSLYPVYTHQDWMIDLVRTGIVDSNFPTDAGFSSLVIPKQLGNFSDHNYIKHIWNAYFQGIANANLALKYIPDIVMDEEDKKNLLSEAHFLRAYDYFYLVRMFGGIPLILEPLEGLNTPDLQPTNANVEDIYTSIVNDLKTAEEASLPFDRSGRVTIGAIKSLLSSVYFTMAGYPLQKGVQYYQLARDKAEEVITSGQYSPLFSGYSFLRDPQFNNQGELIFEIQFDENNNPNNSLQQGMIPYRSGISKYSAEEGFVFVPKEFVNTFEAGDIRAKEGEFFYNSAPAIADPSRTITFQDTYIHKFYDENAMLVTAKSGLNWPVLRLPEVLLIFAEASNELSASPEAEAYNAINQIRSRAGLNDLSALSKDEFRKAVWMERYHELCFEDKIWFDMVRTRKALDIVSGNFEDYVGHKFIYGITLQERDLLFPLPNDELRNNPNLDQNPGFKD